LGGGAGHAIVFIFERAQKFTGGADHGDGDLGGYQRLFCFISDHRKTSTYKQKQSTRGHSTSLHSLYSASLYSVLHDGDGTLAHRIRMHRP